MIPVRVRRSVEGVKKEANIEDGGEVVGVTACQGRKGVVESRGAVSALSLLTTRGQCWPQAAWLCWKTTKERPGRERKEASIY